MKLIFHSQLDDQQGAPVNFTVAMCFLRVCIEIALKLAATAFTVFVTVTSNQRRNEPSYSMQACNVNLLKLLV